MKVVCVGLDHKWNQITVGKWYETDGYDGSLDRRYIIKKNDNGSLGYYPIKLFLTIEEYRESQIDMIL